VTGPSIMEYAEAIRERYLKSPKKVKIRILDEFVAATGLHRKAAIWLLNRRSRPLMRRRGPRRLYGLEVMVALKTTWEATDRLCSRVSALFTGAGGYLEEKR
jgi:hypothetical protein